MLCPICRRDPGSALPEGEESWHCGFCGWGQQAAGPAASPRAALAVPRALALLLQVIGVVAVGTAAGYLIFKSSLLILVVWPALGCLSIAMVAALCPYAKEWFVVLMATVMHVSLYAFGVAIGGGHTFVEGLSAFVEDLLKWDSGVRVMVFGWLLQVALGLVLAWRKGRLS